jgi:hypothetical protein
MKLAKQRSKKQSGISINELASLDEGDNEVLGIGAREITIMNCVLRIALIGVTLLTVVSNSWATGQQDRWPCGELPKLLRNQKGEPLWLGWTKLNKRVVNRVDPRLPSSVRLEGNIIADVLIGSDGHVRCVRVRKGHPILRRAVEEAAKQWTFKPILMRGKPVAVFGVLKFHFSN